MASLPIAYNLIRNGSHYRREAYTRGMENLGYKVRHHTTQQPNPEDVLLIWNRYGDFQNRARQFEKAGAKVIVIENGYYSKEKTFAVSLFQHHHGGLISVRKNKIVHPQDGKHILICAQRGIGSDMMASPPSWHNIAKDKLEKFTRRKIIIRNHPGKDPPKIPLQDQLKNCHACIVWSSAAGIEALLNRVQVFYDAPRWIAELSAKPLACVYNRDCDINKLYDYSNAGINNALANQHTLEQISSGTPFKRILDHG